MHDSSATPTGNCDLLQLPAELRDYIYRLVLSEKTFPDPPRRATSIFDLNPARGIYIELGFRAMRYDAQPHLICVSRQVRSESLAVFYEKCVFFIHVDADALHANVEPEDLGPHGKHVSIMRHFEFQIRCRRDYLFALDSCESKPRKFQLRNKGHPLPGRMVREEKMQAMQRGQDMLVKLIKERGEDVMLEVDDLVELFKLLREYRVAEGIGQKSLATVHQETERKGDMGDYGYLEDGTP